MKNIEKIPVVFIVYNRPELTKITFKKIKIHKPKKLFIICDGPKNNLLDRNKCQKVRSIVSRINWQCKVYKNFSNKNLGCKKRIITGLNWVFTKVNQAIIIEDDCLVNKSFFKFCYQLLNKYKFNARVFMITGTNLLENYSQKKDYFYSNYGIIWGWATWKRSWKKYKYQKYFWKRYRNKIDWNFLGFNNIAINHWINLFNKVYFKNYNTWDYQLWASMWLNKSYAIVPRLNMVTNLGFNSKATHTKYQADKKKKKKNNICNIKEYNESINHDKFYEDKLVEKYYSINNYYINFKKKIINFFFKYFY